MAQSAGIRQSAGQCSSSLPSWPSALWLPQLPTQATSPPGRMGSALAPMPPARIAYAGALSRRRSGRRGRCSSHAGAGRDEDRRGHLGHHLLREREGEPAGPRDPAEGTPSSPAACPCARARACASAYACVCVHVCMPAPRGARHRPGVGVAGDPLRCGGGRCVRWPHRGASEKSSLPRLTTSMKLSVSWNTTATARTSMARRLLSEVTWSIPPPGRVASPRAWQILQVPNSIRRRSPTSSPSGNKRGHR